eukprot:Hpha_TRINITY_DN15933_c4_g3::TRINITY_DN15933_c4_g3_i1::g.72963::m.72963
MTSRASRSGVDAIIGVCPPPPPPITAPPLTPSPGEQCLPCLPGTPVCCNPKVVGSKCPNNIDCCDCGVDACACPGGPAPGPGPSPAPVPPQPTCEPCTGSGACCDPNQGQLCPGNIECCNCGTNACQCPSAPGPAPKPAPGPAPPRCHVCSKKSKACCIKGQVCISGRKCCDCGAESCECY